MNEQKISQVNTYHLSAWYIYGRTLHSIYNNLDDEYNPVPHLFEVNQKGVYTYRRVVEVALQPYTERQMAQMTSCVQCGYSLSKPLTY